jgi:hypothetical protein
MGVRMAATMATLRDMQAIYRRYPPSGAGIWNSSIYEIEILEIHFFL